MDSIEPIIPLRPEPPSVAPSARIAPTGRESRGGQPDTPGRRRRRPHERDEDAVMLAVEGIETPSCTPQDGSAVRRRVDLSA